MNNSTPRSYVDDSRHNQRFNEFNDQRYADEPQPRDEPRIGPVKQPARDEMMKSMTPEDTLFFKAWQRDSFYYRVLPLSIASWSGLYYYNITKQLPHKVTHYFMLSLGSFFIGKALYVGELRRRIETTHIDTPFMKQFKAALRVSRGYDNYSSQTNNSGDLAPSTNFDFDSNFSDDKMMGTGYQNDGFASNEFDTTITGLDGESRGFPINQDNGAFNYDHSTQDALGGGRQGPSVSYDELRAKNRNLVR